MQPRRQKHPLKHSNNNQQLRHVYHTSTPTNFNYKLSVIKRCTNQTRTASLSLSFSSSISPLFLFVLLPSLPFILCKELRVYIHVRVTLGLSYWVWRWWYVLMGDRHGTKLGQLIVSLSLQEMRAERANERVNHWLRSGLVWFVSCVLCVRLSVLLWNNKNKADVSVWECGEDWCDWVYSVTSSLS